MREGEWHCLVFPPLAAPKEERLRGEQGKARQGKARGRLDKLRMVQLPQPPLLLLKPVAVCSNPRQSQQMQLVHMVHIWSMHGPYGPCHTIVTQAILSHQHRH